MWKRAAVVIILDDIDEDDSAVKEMTQMSSVSPLRHGWLAWKGKATNLGLRHHGEQFYSAVEENGGLREEQGSVKSGATKGSSSAAGRGKHCRLITPQDLTRGHPSILPPPIFSEKKIQSKLNLVSGRVARASVWARTVWRGELLGQFQDVRHCRD